MLSQAKLKISLDLPECMEDLLFATVADDGRPVRHRAAYGGRGSTKSHSFARGLLLRGSTGVESILCARETQKSIDGSVKKLLDTLIPQMGFGPTNGDGFYFSQKYSIVGRNGTDISFAGLQTNVDNVRSAEGISIAYVNEARRVSQNSIDTLTPTIRRPGSEIWWDWNPGTDKDPVDVMFRSGNPPPGSIVRCVNYPQNPWFGEPLLSEMLWDQKRDPDKYAHIWLGEYQRNSEARVFRNWTVEEFDTPSNATFRLGADWGFSVDPTVLIRCFIGRWENGEAIADDNGRHLFVDYEAYEVGCEIMKTPALFDTVPDSRKWPITADSARPETISHMRLNGFPKIVAAVKGARSVEEGVEFLKTYDIVVHPRCVHAIDDLTLYSFETDLLTGSVTNKLADKSNNVIDALRYACEGATRAARVKPPAAPVAIPAMRTGFNSRR